MTTIPLFDNPRLFAVTLNRPNDQQSQALLPVLGRALVLTLTAALISFALLQLMAQLIQSEAPVMTKVVPVIELTPLVPRQESAAKKIIREVPPPPIQQVVPKIASPTSADPGELLDVPISTAQPSIALAGPTLDTPQSADKAATPLVRIEPKYPPLAAREGLNGWVRLRFNIAADGRVTDIKVLAAEPKRVFEQEAMRALRNWKYQPKLENGRAVAQSDLEVQLDFRLDQQN